MHGIPLMMEKHWTWRQGTYVHFYTPFLAPSSVPSTQQAVIRIISELLPQDTIICKLLEIQTKKYMYSFIEHFKVLLLLLFFFILWSLWSKKHPFREFLRGRWRKGVGKLIWNFKLSFIYSYFIHYIYLLCARYSLGTWDMRVNKIKAYILNGDRNAYMSQLEIQFSKVFSLFSKHRKLDSIPNSYG